jgi:hypothetical protein
LDKSVDKISKSHFGFDYFESNNPYVTRKMKLDPRGYTAWVLLHPIEAFRQKFCIVKKITDRKSDAS